MAWKNDWILLVLLIFYGSLFTVLFISLQKYRELSGHAAIDSWPFMVVDSRLVLNKWALNRFPLLQLFHTATISFPLASVEQVEIGYSSYLSIAGFNSYARIHTQTGKKSARYWYSWSVRKQRPALHNTKEECFRTMTLLSEKLTEMCIPNYIRKEELWTFFH